MNRAGNHLRNSHSGIHFMRAGVKQLVLTTRVSHANTSFTIVDKNKVHSSVRTNSVDCGGILGIRPFNGIIICTSVANGRIVSCLATITRVGPSSNTCPRFTGIDFITGSNGLGSLGVGNRPISPTGACHVTALGFGTANNSKCPHLSGGPNCIGANFVSTRILGTCVRGDSPLSIDICRPGNRID